MAHMINDLAKFFTWDDIDIDNWNFKLFYKGCAMFFFGGSLVGVMSQYFGEPINCDFKGMESELASDYCWIHGSSYIPPEYQRHMKCIVDLEGIESADDAPDTSYYQWVTFVMLFQAGFTILPHKIWTVFEGGLISSFGSEAKSAILLKPQDKCDEGVVMQPVVEKFVKYFQSILHHNNVYFMQFFFCEILNYLMLVFNFWATDQFLDGKFRYYGWEVMKFYGKTKQERKTSVNPFCHAFPTEVSCTVPNVGAAGGEQNHNGLCVLSQNIINEKVYLALWFWLIIVGFISLLFFFYRLCLLFFDCLRALVLKSRIYNKNDPELSRSVNRVLEHCYIGDWFVLYQLSKNVNRFFFREFMKELARELNRNPKGGRRSSRVKASSPEEEKIKGFTVANCVGEKRNVIEKGEETPLV